jgi:hypothetical protein
MSRSSFDNMDLRRIRRLLRETTRLAERASMTGSLQGGGRIAIRQYNAIREHLQDTKVIPEDLFQELDEDEATFDELGVVTGMLESYLEDEEPAAEAEGERAGEGFDGRRTRKWKRHGPWGPEVARFWGDPNALSDLQRMGEELREHLPELLKWREHMRSGPHPPSPPEPPTPPVPPNPPASAAPGAPNTASRAGEERSGSGAGAERRSDLAARIQAISEALQREDLNYQRRMELSRELADLASGRID